MRELYFTHIFPLLIGSIAVWGTDDNKRVYIQPLIRTQKRIIRLIAHTDPIMSKLNILNITNLYTLRVSIEMHPFIYPRTPLNRPEHNNTYIYATHIHEHKTRYSTKRHQFIPNTNKYSKIVRPYHTIDHYTTIYATVWNKLPEGIRTISELDDFKRKLRKHLMNKQAYHY